MTYKGYEASIAFDDEAGIFHGETVNTRDLITFQGVSVAELRQAFRDSVDDYLAFCAERSEEPDSPFSGDLTLHLSPQLHRDLFLNAKREGRTVDAYIERRLREKSAF